MAEVLRLGGRK